MTTTSTSVLLALALLPLAADAHGYMTKPPSRSDLAHETHCVASVGQVSDCAGCGSRGYPGVNPWSAPATSVDKDTGLKATFQEKPHVTNERGDPAVMGVCGVAMSARLDYNKPTDSRYGYSPVEEYAPGEEITVEWWCAVHKFIASTSTPSTRPSRQVELICTGDDQSLVDLLLDPTRTPTNAEYEQLEACFDRGNIRCDSVDGNDCGMVDDCYASGAANWEACQEGEYIVRLRVNNISTCREPRASSTRLRAQHCRSALGQTDRRYRCQNTYDSCEHGSLARYRLKIPESTKPSAHTILNFRWDTFENNEAFMGCADIKITGDPAPAPAPVSTPTPKPVSAPTPKPQADDSAGYCCFWPQTADRCGQCTSPAQPGNWCAKGRKECEEDCGHVWCDDDDGDAPVAEPTAKPVPSPTAKPVPSPTPKPVSPTAKPVSAPTPKPQADDSAGYCCFWPQTADRCGQCESPAQPGNWCAKGRKECEEDCGHVWCDDGDDAPVADPTAKPVPSPTARPVSAPTPKPVSPTAKPVAPPTATCDDVQEQVAVLQAQIDELLSQPCGDDDACDVELYAVEGEDVYDSMGVRRDCCPGLEPTLEDRDPSDPLIGTWPQIIVCREPSARRNLRGDAKA